MVRRLQNSRTKVCQAYHFWWGNTPNHRSPYAQELTNVTKEHLINPSFFPATHIYVCMSRTIIKRTLNCFRTLKNYHISYMYIKSTYARKYANNDISDLNDVHRIITIESFIYIYINNLLYLIFSQLNNQHNNTLRHHSFNFIKYMVIIPWI